VPLSASDDGNAAQIEYWNGPGGMRWLESQQTHDVLLAKAGELLIARATPTSGEVALDIGCGCSATTIELAKRVVPRGRVLGVDVSAPMIELARRRAPKELPIEFVEADATVYQFEPGRADLLLSRFGVMFFADPLRSFSNMRVGLRKGARVVFVCWREPRMNAWLMLPLQEAYRHVPRLPEMAPDDPGPFSFASEQRVRGVLERAGFDRINLEPVELTFDLANGGGLSAAVETAMHIGPTSRALDGQPAEKHTAVAESIRAALAPFESKGSIPLPGAFWIVTARNP